MVEDIVFTVVQITVTIVLLLIPLVAMFHVVRK